MAFFAASRTAQLLFYYSRTAILSGVIAGLLLHSFGNSSYDAQAAHHAQGRAVAAPSASASCAALLERGRAEYPVALLASLPRLWPPTDMPKVAQSGGRSSMASPACALYVEAPGEGAPLGLRLLGWATAYSAAENFGVTFVHAPFDDAGAADPDAPAAGGWDDALGLGAGEPTAASLRAAAAAEGRPAPQTKALESWRGVRYDEDVFRRGPWWGDMNEVAENCGRILRVPPLSRPYDATWHSKGAMALRFARAREARAARGADPPLLWDAERDVNIAVHVRRVAFADAEGPSAGIPFDWDDPISLSAWENDEATAGESGSLGAAANGEPQFQGQRVWYPTRETVLARVVRETVLPALLAEGLPPERLVVHVFSQWPHAAGFPALAALAQRGGVRVAFHLGAALGAWPTLLHLTQADVLVGSASHFSFFAALLSSRPLVLAQEDFDKWRLCGEGSVCCRRSGECEFYAGVRVRELARRLGALRRCGGGLA